jgi:response regulator of citrate/malate metabolism
LLVTNQLTAQVVISDYQARRVLEIKDSLDIGKLEIHVKNEIIIHLDSALQLYVAKADSLAKVHQNSQAVIDNCKEDREQLERMNEKLIKESKRSNTEKVIGKGIIILLIGWILGSSL